ncbi:MAG TPA: hypothetical protein PKH10_05960 [bacterium]|nr:hypothetical protein [bacterium]
MMPIRVGLFCSFLLFVFAGASLFAQEGENEKQAEKGFRLSDTAVMNVHFTLAPEFESNINNVSTRSYYEDHRDSANNYTHAETKDLVLHLSPGIRAKIDDKFKTLAMAFLINYNLYTGLDDKKSFEKLTTLSALHFDTDILGEFNKDGNVVVRALNNLKRNSNLDVLTIENGLHTNLLEDFSLSVYVKNSEETLSLKLSSGIQLNYFEESLFSPYNFWSSRSNAYGQWKFLPKTAAFFNASFTYQDYFNADPVSRHDQRSMPLSVFVGVLGQITPKISLKLLGGYANSFSKEMHHDGLAGAEFVYKHSENTLFNLGYLRSLSPVAVYQYYSMDKAYLGFTQKLLHSRLLLKFDASYSHLAYGKNVKYPLENNPAQTRVDDNDTPNDASDDITTVTTVTQKSVDREDHLIRIEPMVSYNILHWLGISLKYSFETKQTPFYATTRITRSGGGVPPSDVSYHLYYDYMDHRVLLSLAADY